jgi:hypothetical protein
MSRTFWRPANEAESVGGMAVFVEWLRATGRMTGATPKAVRHWRDADRGAMRGAIAAFAGLDEADGVRASLLRHDGRRVALMARDAAGEQRRWTYADLRSAGDLPPAVATMLAGLTWPALMDLAADHLLFAGTRPDDTVRWTGDPAAPWPYGAWIVGATVLLAAPAQAASFRSA